MFGRRIEKQFVHHARCEYPQEACALVVGNDLVPCANIHSDPYNHFEIAPEIYGKWLVPVGGRGGGPSAPTVGAPSCSPLRAVLHSHTNGKDWPSRNDQVQQAATRLPWGICMVDSTSVRPMFWFGDEVPTPDLYGRQFRHGVTDCYGLVRDYYRVTYGILIKNYPRDDEWWNHGGNLLLDYFADAGFYRIDAVDKPGDVVLAEVLSKVPNHCGVHVGNGELLHHLTDRPSRIDQLGHWMKFVRMSLRYEGL